MATGPYENSFTRTSRREPARNAAPKSRISLPLHPGYDKAMQLRVCLPALLALLLAAPAPAAELRGHGGPVRAIAVTADGSGAITGSFDTSAILWSLPGGTARQVLRFHFGQVIAVAALPDGRFATAGEDAKIALWQEGEEAPVQVFQ